MSVFGRNEWFIRQKAQPALLFELKLPDYVKDFFKCEMKGIFKSENDSCAVVISLCVDKDG